MIVMTINGTYRTKDFDHKGKVTDKKGGGRTKSSGRLNEVTSRKGETPTREILLNLNSLLLIVQLKTENEVAAKH